MENINELLDILSKLNGENQAVAMGIIASVSGIKSYGQGTASAIGNSSATANKSGSSAPQKLGTPPLHI